VGAGAHSGGLQSFSTGGGALGDKVSAVDMGPRFRQRLRAGRADTLPAAGDQRGFSS